MKILLYSPYDITLSLSVILSALCITMLISMSVWLSFVYINIKFKDLKVPKKNITTYSRD